jgi:nickel transport protein
VLAVLRHRIALTLLGAAAPALGHGISGTPVSGGAGVAARYDDGSPASFSEVKVYAPGDTNVFQEGLTDREGRFVFHPASAGVWRIRVDDGMGHALDQEVRAGPDGTMEEAPAAPRESRGQSVLTGLSLIAGFFGALAWLKSRRRA